MIKYVDLGERFKMTPSSQIRHIDGVVSAENETKRKYPKTARPKGFNGARAARGSQSA